MQTQFARVLATLTLCAGLQQAAAQDTAFTYQGQLQNNGSPANGIYDMRLLLFSALTGGSQVGNPQTNIGVGVSNGLFTLTVDFGPVFTGSSNWLRIDVRTNGGSSFTQLAPRQQLTPAPYAIFASTAGNVSGVVASANLSGTYGNALTLNNAANTFTGNGGGLTGLNASQLTGGTVPDAELSGNVAFLNGNQSFTGSNSFSGLNASLTISGTGPISTSLFTGLGFQFYNSSGEGAIISSVNDANASLTFYTKPGPGFPPAKQMKVDRYGVVMIDQQNVNNGVLNDGTTNGVGLNFGSNSGEGIASQRTAGVNQYGLDFYTAHTRQMSILNNGNVGIGTTNPTTALQVSGAVTATAFSGGGGGLIGLNANNLSSGTVPNATLPSSPTFSGAVTANSFSGNGSNLTSLNATQLTTGTVPNARLSGNVAFLNGNQSFTGSNSFSGLGASLSISGTGPISTSLFTGLGFQFYNSSGEGAIMSSVNDANASLSFYTKSGAGLPIAKQMAIDRYGVVAIDQQGVNGGTLNDGTTNGVGLVFGLGSGEGIASQRQAGSNQYGLDFYTDFTHRMSISQSGLVGIGVATNQPGTQLEVSGDVRIDGHRLLLAPSATSVYANDGLSYDASGLGGINNNSGPFLGGYFGGALGGLAPTTASLSWDPFGNVWVNKSCSVGSLEVRGEYLVVDGLTPVQAYFGDDGINNDVNIGSQKSGVTVISCYNTADQAYMHINVSSISIKGGADLAEPFQMANQGKNVPQGAVMVIDDENPGRLKMSDQPYDSRVAGVVSGANGIHPGIQMEQQGLLEGGRNVALTGRVYVQADNSNGAIKPGDLLTTSSTPGRAMKVTNHAKAQGAILGKAMTALKDGQGMVLVLVTLQ